MMIELFTQHLREFGATIDDAIKFLSDFGYQPYVITRSGGLTPLRAEHYDVNYNVVFKAASLGTEG